MNIECTQANLNEIVEASARFAPIWASSDSSARARVLRAIATAMEEDADSLIAQANQETHLGEPRLTGELARTVFQLRGFAKHVEDGAAFAHIADPAIPGPPPAGRPQLTRVRTPVGPVAVFAASNFPFAFSVLGGDTASALAAGCPVVVKAHPAHPLLSRLLHAVASKAVQSQAVDAALLGLVMGASEEIGLQLVAHPRVAAVAFTGSFQGGMALQAHASRRPSPIPFYGELGSINPIVVLPAALQRDGAELAHALAASMTLGCAQFCTSPGIIVVFRQLDATRQFREVLCEALASQSLHMMLSPTIRAGFDRGVERLLACPDVDVLLGDRTPPDSPPKPIVVRATARTFLEQDVLRREVFGPASVLVEVDSADEVVAVLRAIEGSLTTTVWGASEPTPDNISIVRSAIETSGRVIFAGVPTGVAVTQAQHHGGPFPSSTQPFTTSVGYAAMDRFLRPLALQDAPNWILEREGRAV